MEITLSIVIVNYNVQYFIEQCLHSIYRLSDHRFPIEVIVIDNASSDGSVGMIRKQFPDVRLIENAENVGFSKANNQGFEVSSGKYILMLNPDTILEEDTLQKCFEKMESDAEIGVLGVRMVDGGGKYLPESKRGFPTPSRAFFKFTGLYRLAPGSKFFNGYYFGQVPENQEAEVEILCGAFMFMRSNVLEQTGYLDESFFMYGEDIDLSFRISNAGFKVWYYPETTIIHFKGESTRKQTSQYIRRFYDAMDIFARKHFKTSKAKAFLNSLSLVIRFKSVLNRVRNLLNILFLPMLDFILIWLILLFVSKGWAVFYFEDPEYYDEAPIYWNFLMYAAIWLVALFYSGAYDKKIRSLKILRNLVISTVIILACYGLLPTAYRTSRAIILISAAGVGGGIFILRMVTNFLKSGKWTIDAKSKKRLLLISSRKNADEVREILLHSGNPIHSIISVPTEVSVSELKELIKINRIDEIICHSSDVGMKKVISLMAQLGDLVGFKITGDETLGIIGSISKNTNGEIYTVTIRYAIQDAYNKRLKRSLDILGGIVLILFSPILVMVKRGLSPIREGWKCLIGKKTLVGYILADSALKDLPEIKQGLIPVRIPDADMKYHHALNVDYAKNYSVWEDVRRFGQYLIKKDNDSGD